MHDEWQDFFKNAGWAEPDRREGVGLKPVGKNFDKDFVVDKMLGEGGFAKVYLCTHKKSKVKFAVKHVLLAGDPSGELRGQVVEEIEIMKRINHPNVVKLYSMYQDPAQFRLVMELMEGGELFDRIVAKTSYNESEARDLMRVLLEAIKFIHSEQVVHRDLKPENLLMLSATNDFQVKIADFGFAKSVEAGPCTDAIGTPVYVAPEVLLRKPYSLPVDVWSLGVIFFILLCGEPPFHDHNQQKLYRKIRNGQYEFHPDKWAGVSQEAMDLVRRMLTVKVSERITAEQALQHPWMAGGRHRPDLEAHDLGQQLKNLKLFNARRKLQGAVRAVIFAQKMSAAMGPRDGIAARTAAFKSSPPRYRGYNRDNF